MRGSRKIALTLITLSFIFCLLATAPAWGNDVLAGVDLWTTPAGGATVDSHFTVMPIPPGFFDPGSDPFTGVIVLKGKPLSTPREYWDQLT